MDQSMAIAGAVGIGVALLLMYLILKRYTYPAVEEPFFSDPRFFMLFTIGLVEGGLLLVLYTYIMPWYSEAGTGLLVAVFFGAITELVKVVTMNLKRFNGKSDSIFYGFGLGLGMGAAMCTGLIYYLTSRTTMDAASWVIIIVMSLQNIFLHAGTGIVIGEGIARYRPFEFLAKALVINVAYQLLMLPVYMGNASSSMYWLAYVCMAIATILVIVNLYITVYKKLPKIVSEVLEMEGKKRNDIPGME